ncbi:hypothetical protein [Fluviispira sanaruensis]|uniref:Uncharacterized protein n=1 Tax=Fluviispira sanaruensis TaxID=2493639 RepID=A0A4P2VLW3_FLUSA|nr:hypothetical protein [Fluviispira sanaruensis]BBH52984.1 hypothetical protein JCM31447_14270 [Fluviispira sanaruensis]
MFYLKILLFLSKLIKSQFKGFIIIFFLFNCIACKSSDIKVQDSINSTYSAPPLEDKKYGPILAKWYRENSIYRDLEMVFQSSATLLTPDMKEAYEKRLLETQGVGAKIDKNIMSDSTTFAIVVNHFIKTKALLELNDNKLWNLQLFINGKSYSPEGVISYKNKEILSSYFPDSSFWSRFYVVHFKLPSHLIEEISAEENVGKRSLPQNGDRTIVFTMNSGEVQIKFSWNR